MEEIKNPETPENTISKPEETPEIKPENNKISDLVLSTRKFIKVDVKCDYCDKLLHSYGAYHRHMFFKHNDKYAVDYPDRIKEIIKFGKYNCNRKNQKIPPKEALKEETAGEEMKLKEKTNFNYENKEIIKEDMLQESIDDSEPFPYRGKEVTKPLKGLLNKTSISLEPRENYMAQLLIETGFAKDLSDVQRKSLRLAYSLLNAGGLNAGGLGGMQNLQCEEKDIDKMLEEFEKQKIRKLKIQQFETEIQKQSGGKKMDTGEMILLMSLFNKPQNTGMDMNQMMQMMTILNQNKPQQNDLNQVLEITKLLNLQQPKDGGRDNIELLKFMLEQSKGNNNMTDVIKLITEKSKDDTTRMIELQKIRNEGNVRALMDKITQMESQIRNKSGKDSFDEDALLEKIEKIKRIGEMLSTENKEPTTLDYIDVIGQHFGPVVKEVIAKKASQQNYPQQQVAPQSRPVNDDELMEIHRKNLQNETRRKGRPRKSQMMEQQTQEEEIINPIHSSPVEGVPDVKDDNNENIVQETD